MRSVRSTRFGWAWWVLAHIALAVGLVGVVVPVLPTVPFILLAAYAAARGSNRLHRWLLTHRRFGSQIRDWQEHGTVGRHAKWLASGAMAVSTIVMLVFAPEWWIAAAGTAMMGIVATWLWLRPEPTHG